MTKEQKKWLAMSLVQMTFDFGTSDGDPHEDEPPKKRTFEEKLFEKPKTRHGLTKIGDSYYLYIDNDFDEIAPFRYVDAENDIGEMYRYFDERYCDELLYKEIAKYPWHCVYTMYAPRIRKWISLFFSLTKRFVPGRPNEIHIHDVWEFNRRKDDIQVLPFSKSDIDNMSRYRGRSICDHTDNEVNTDMPSEMAFGAISDELMREMNPCDNLPHFIE